MCVCLQMCFRCTRSSICGTHYCWVTPLSHSVLEWPYCSSSGTVSWQMASMSASYCSLTCQVRIWASTFRCGNANFKVRPDWQQRQSNIFCMYSAIVPLQWTRRWKPEILIFSCRPWTWLISPQSITMCMCTCVRVHDNFQAWSSALLHMWTPLWWALGIPSCALYLSSSQSTLGGVCQSNHSLIWFSSISCV